MLAIVEDVDFKLERPFAVAFVNTLLVKSIRADTVRIKQINRNTVGNRFIIISHFFKA